MMMMHEGEATSQHYRGESDTLKQVQYRGNSFHITDRLIIFQYKNYWSFHVSASVQLSRKQQKTFQR